MTTPQLRSPTDNRTRLWHFARHLLEMVVAMVVGMAVLGLVWTVTLDALGVPGLLDRTVPDALIMATNMTVAMGAWMRYLGHGWPATLQMAAAMYLSFVVFFPFLWLGLVSGDGVLVGGHILMVPAMVAAMLLRLDEYTDRHPRRRMPR